MKRRTVRSTSKNSMQTVFTRFMLIVAVFIFWIGAIGVRLVHLQVNQHKELRTQAMKKRQYVHKTKALRGTIYDRTERTLAMSIKVNSLYANPLQIKNIDSTAAKIAKILKRNRKSIAKSLREGKSRKKRFVWIAKKLDQDLYEKVNETLVDKDIKKKSFPKYTGLYWRKEQKRQYPYKNLAANVIGFSDSKDEGQAGIELSQEDYLRGEIVQKWRKRDRLGRVYRENRIKPEEPLDVVLTLSNSIQYKTEEALARAARRSRARSGKAIVLDPKTGEILAMANYPSFDPNRLRRIKSGAWKNRVIEDRYTPGSVFKLVTYGSALEEKLITPEETVDCGNGTITVARHTFNDSHAIGEVSYIDAFAQSSNVGAIKVSKRVGKQTFYQYAQKFGFGKKTGIGLPAESNGILRHPSKWNGDSLASMSIGYEIGVTALQSAAAFATIANDGIKIQPHIIKEIRKSDGEVVETTEPKTERVVSEETASGLRRMLRQVVLDGTAKRAKLNGFTAAGKTGTAWKYDPKLKKVNSNLYVSSFIGFAPADNPRVVIAVILDEPKGVARSGGYVAAPVFKEIAENILPELGVTPDAEILDELSESEELLASEEARKLKTIGQSIEPAVQEKKVPKKKLSASRSKKVSQKKPAKSKEKRKTSGEDRKRRAVTPNRKKTKNGDKPSKGKPKRKT
ncbi:MAG: penicillin-binding protein 2 [Pyrinomonadaceae bacterium]|nr:penicillin-binding protein 2 [Pyrinomonadaceae bacterium]